MAKVTVNAQRVISEVNKFVFGHFQEHAFGNIYGGIYDPGNGKSDERGFRTDVLKAMKEVKVPMLRYPGGNFVSNYHWEDGIGPKDQRKRVFEYAWHTEESNQFGTIDFIELCREVGAEPYICVNMGTGTIEEAMHWVEYCNGTGNTYYANLRRSHGYEEPFNVKYWGLGNEVYGAWQMGYMDAIDYTKKAVEFAKAMKWADPAISLVACGAEQGADWNYEAIKKLAPYVEYISAHHYSTGWGAFDRNDYMQLMCISDYLRQINELMKSAINCGCDNSYGKIKIAWDEWNMFGWVVEGVNDDKSYTMENAVVTASILNFFIRNSDSVKIANYSTFVNINGAVSVHKDDIVRRPQYHSIHLIGTNTGSKQLDCFVQSETFTKPMPVGAQKGRKVASIAKEPYEEFYQYTLPYIDAVATADDDFIYISIVNKHPKENILTEFEITGCNIDESKNEMKMIYHEDLKACNTIEYPSNVKIDEVDIGKAGNKFTIDLAKHSVNIIKLKKA